MHTPRQPDDKNMHRIIYILQVKYLSDIQCFVSCDCSSDKSMYLGDILGKKANYYFQIQKGKLYFYPKLTKELVFWSFNQVSGCVNALFVVIYYFLCNFDVILCTVIIFINSCCNNIYYDVGHVHKARLTNSKTFNVWKLTLLLLCRCSMFWLLLP